MNRKVSPRSAWIDFSKFSTSAWIDTSSAATLSSATTNRGPDTSALAIEIRCRCPPEKRVGKPAKVLKIQAAFGCDFADALVRLLTAGRYAHDLQRLRDNVANRHSGTQRRVRILEDELGGASGNP